MSALVAVWSGIGYAVGAIAHKSWLRRRSAEEEAEAKEAEASVSTLETPHKWVLTWGREYLVVLAFTAVLLSAASAQYYLNGISRVMPSGPGWWLVWLPVAAIASLIMSFITGWKGRGVHGIPVVSWAGFGIVTGASLAPQMVMVAFDSLLSWLLSGSHLVYVINVLGISGIGIAGVASVLHIRCWKKQSEDKNDSPTSTSVVCADEPVKSGENDVFGRKFYAEGLANLILDKKPGWVLGIGGEWGSGKTSFMNLIDEAMFEIREYKTRPKMESSWARKKTDKNKGLVVVRLNLWEHQHDAVPAVALLQAARDLLPPSKTDAVNRQIREIVQVSLEAMATAGNVLTTGAVARPSVLWKWITDIAPSREAGFETQERAFSLAQRFSEIIDQVLEYYGADRLVFMVDDLDRCMPGRSVDILEKVQLFFRRTNKCVFVLGVDSAVLELAVSQQYRQLGAGEGAKNWARRYLKKIVSIWYPIPVVGMDGRRTYVDELLKLMTDSFEKEEVARLFVEGSDEAQASLRQVKELVNEFLLYHFIQKRHPTVLGSPASLAEPDSSATGDALETTSDEADDEVEVLVTEDAERTDGEGVAIESGNGPEPQDAPPPAQAAPGTATPETPQPVTEEAPFPATGEYNSWLLAAVTAIQVLYPDEYKKMASPGQPGKQAIREWFCATEETTSSEGSSGAKPPERLRQAIMSHMRDNAVLAKAISEGSEDLVKEISHYIQLVVNSAATEEKEPLSDSTDTPETQQSSDSAVVPATPVISETEDAYAVGKVVKFGGRDWHVLKRENDGGQERALLLSKQILPKLKPYHNLPDAAAWQALVARAKAGESLTWDKCTLREWLNSGKHGQAGVDPWVLPSSGSYVWVPSSDKDRDSSGGKQKDGESVWGTEGFLSDFSDQDLLRIALTTVETKSELWSGKEMDDFAKEAKTQGYDKRFGLHPETWAKNWMDFHGVKTDNEKREISGGATVKCRVFLLSREEYGKYLRSDNERVAIRGEQGDPWWWWLRSPGSHGSVAANVGGVGWLSRGGTSVHSSTGGVRPALWLNL